MNYSIQDNIENINSIFNFELNLNSDESIIKLISINCYFTKFDKNFIVSKSEEGVIRLHMVLNEINKNDFQDIYTIKNCAQYKRKLEDNILKANNISYIEKRKKIIVIISIKYKLEIVTFELNNEKIWY